MWLARFGSFARLALCQALCALQMCQMCVGFSVSFVRRQKKLKHEALIVSGCIGLVKCEIVIVCLGRLLCLPNVSTVANRLAGNGRALRRWGIL